MNAELLNQWLNGMKQGNQPEGISFIEVLQSEIHLGRFNDESAELKMKETAGSTISKNEL
ncbi:hypothetical protein EHS13_18635 [Paenibacillus psychroresistens]|uniref:Uncharacterized protein n=1 Tax=Paenibacillus psychroresistens TaxID=1778678 RepID=A0A6B8RK08_9BACL|nr:hypothetical protein [Paenibacillus psychroresistens]QGQ96751.1 hypothetical protein EHS13_18635 [Paenibacillus psychroresistens]